MSEIRLTKDDVSMDDLLPHGCDDCTDGACGSKPVASTIVMLDFRAVGETVQFGKGEYCVPCAERLVTRLRDGLPERETETQQG